MTQTVWGPNRKSSGANDGADDGWVLFGLISVRSQSIFRLSTRIFKYVTFILQKQVDIQ